MIFFVHHTLFIVHLMASYVLDSFERLCVNSFIGLSAEDWRYNKRKFFLNKIHIKLISEEYGSSHGDNTRKCLHLLQQV